MPTSPGAILPGSTPAAASSSVLKGLFTLQGAALLGAGAWLFLRGRRGKATRKNPQGKFRAKARRRVRGKFLKANEAIRRDYDKWWSTSRAATSGRSYGSPASWARKTKIVKLAAKAGALGKAAKSVISQARRHQGIFRRSWFKTYGKTLDNPSSKTAARYEARMRKYFAGKGRMPKSAGLTHDESWAIIWKIQDELGHKRSVPLGRNPTAAWGRARVKARGKWLKRRFGKNPSAWERVSSARSRMHWAHKYDSRFLHAEDQMLKCLNAARAKGISRAKRRALLQEARKYRNDALVVVAKALDQRNNPCKRRK